MKMKPSLYTSEEIIDLLKQRQGGITQDQFAKEIGCSPQLLNNIYNGRRSPCNDQILRYLAPRGKRFEEVIVWRLVGD